MAHYNHIFKMFVEWKVFLFWFQTKTLPLLSFYILWKTRSHQQSSSHQESDIQPQDENLNFSATEIRAIFGIAEAYQDLVAFNPESSIALSLIGYKLGWILYPDYIQRLPEDQHDMWIPSSCCSNQIFSHITLISLLFLECSLLVYFSNFIER